MKKILFFTSVLFLVFATNLRAQSIPTITNVVISDSILCNGGFGELTIDISQSSPPTNSLEVVVGTFPFQSLFVVFGVVDIEVNAGLSSGVIASGRRSRLCPWGVAHEQGKTKDEGSRGDVAHHESEIKQLRGGPTGKNGCVGAICTRSMDTGLSLCTFALPNTIISEPWK